MAFGALGAGIVAAFGTTIAATSIAAITVGVVASAVVGAAVGGLVAAVSGGDIGTGMLYGAVGGLAIGAAFGAGIGAALEGTTAVSSAASTTAVVSPAGWEAGVAAGGEVVGTSGGATIATATTTTTAAAEGVGAGISEEYMLGASAIGKGIEEVYKTEVAKDAYERNAVEKQKDRELQEKLSADRLAAASATGSGALSFDERMKLQEAAHEQLTMRNEAEFDARVNQSGVDAENRILVDDNAANLQEEQLLAAQDRAREGILGVAETQQGSYVEFNPEDTNVYEKPSGVLNA